MADKTIVTTDNEKNLWDRINKGDFGYEKAGESAAAYEAFVDYYMLGSKRSLRGLAAMYIKRAKNDNIAKPPTTKESTIFLWSTNFNWQERVKAWQAHDSKIFHEQRDGLRGEIESNEFEDYNKLRTQWTRQFSAFVKAFNDPEYTSSGTGTLIDLIQARRYITELGRLSLGMPSDVKEARLGDTDGNPIKVNRVEYYLPAPADEDAV